MITSDLQFHSVRYTVLKSGEPLYKHSARMAWFDTQRIKKNQENPDEPTFVDWLGDISFFSRSEIPSSADIDQFIIMPRKYRDMLRVKLVTYRLAVRALTPSIGQVGNWEIAPQMRMYKFGTFQLMRERRDLAQAVTTQNVIGTTQYERALSLCKLDAKAHHKKGFNAVIWKQPVFV